MAHTETLSIGVFIDGGYYAKISEGFRAKGMALNVNVKALFSYIPEVIGKEFGIDRKHLYITEAHYYRDVTVLMTPLRETFSEAKGNSRTL
jgi:hypothetical protein